ncbi:hypothetical protein QUB08_05610 [Microcoleus sp. BR0-C5]|uniref:hypothetical protein n=1 Tax=Microcoleus sp. BR0-C5 TaxID=2818713 RepID=UPI002FD6FBE9
MAIVKVDRPRGAGTQKPGFFENSALQPTNTAKNPVSLILMSIARTSQKGRSADFTLILVDKLQVK